MDATFDQTGESRNPSARASLSDTFGWEVTVGDFSGFGRDMLEFLAELENNNNKAFFEANRQRYEDAVREPARAFIREVGKKLGTISKELAASDSKVGGSLMRVHRDTRFGKDKRPYKTNVGIQFRHSLGKDVHAPGCYVHLGLDSCFLGTGMWHPESDALGKIREAIVAKPDRWKRIWADPKLTDRWAPGGEVLKRPPRGFDADHPFIEDLKRKDHILVADLSVKEAESNELVDLCLERFAAAKKHTKFLCEAIGVPF